MINIEFKYAHTLIAALEALNKKGLTLNESSVIIKLAQDISDQSQDENNNHYKNENVKK